MLGIFMIVLTKFANSTNKNKYMIVDFLTTKVIPAFGIILVSAVGILIIAGVVKLLMHMFF